MGTKPAGCADSKCGPWMYTREYFVYLPTGYVNTKAYPLVFEGPGCGGNGQAVYPLNNNADNTVIRVGLTPPPNAIGHATNPNQGCFDDKEGDDSVDWVFYENLWDKLAGLFCFDQNRVFSVGNSSGSWFSNEVGCKYAGDAVHPIRAVMPNTGGLPDQPQYKPTCTTKPMAGMWIHEVGDTTNPFTGNQYAISRAMGVNSCPGGNYAGAMWDDYPVAGSAPMTCRKMRGCPELYPLVVCPLPGNAHGSHDNVANPGFSSFIKQFSAGAFITQ
jgi:poly(3-hydroxybutyrate) depolymerase